MSERTPLYGDTEPLRIRQDKTLSNGDPCNTATLTFSNHSGTHIDAPKHFYQNGRSIAEYRIEELIYKKPQIIDCLKNENELIRIDDLLMISDCDLLLIRTGFFKYRSEDRYRTNNPGISPEAAEWLRREHPNIRAIGIDAISITAFQSREEGRKAHRILLNNDGYPGQPVLLIEDMDLSFEADKISKVYVAPLFIEGIDSISCAVIGEYD